MKSGVVCRRWDDRVANRALGVTAKAIRDEMASGKSLREVVNTVMRSRQINHMTVRAVAERMETDS